MFKTADEVLSAKSSVTGDGIVVVRGAGVEALRAVLKRVPAGSEVILLQLAALPVLDQQTAADVKVAIASQGS
ncbi:MAG: hypothetical protein RL701_6958 [Pseudomonadota bacterium]